MHDNSERRKRKKTPAAHNSSLTQKEQQPTRTTTNEDHDGYTDVTVCLPAEERHETPFTLSLLPLLLRKLFD
ncbi:hypothetical protein ACLKA6_012355 [Drosophila palustris]